MTANRIFIAAILILLVVPGIAYGSIVLPTLFASQGSFVNQQGAIIGGDFPVFYIAGRMALNGAVGSVWTSADFQAQALAEFGYSLKDLNFLYPPVALLLWAPFALLSYLKAFWLWTILPLVALVLFIFRLTGRWPAALLVLVSPLVINNAGTGQTGALFAAVFAAFLLYNQRRPILAGGVSSLFILKPHLAVAISFSLLMARNWRALAAMAALSILIVATATFLFEFQAWLDFLKGVGHHSTRYFQGDAQFYDRTISTVVLLLRLGFSNTAAWAAQILMSLTALCIMIIVWRSSNDMLHRGFALALAVCLVTPKLNHYDLAILLVPIAIVIDRLLQARADFGFVALAVAIWMVPFLAPVFRVWGFNPVALILLTGLVLTLVKSMRSPAGNI